MTSYPLLFAFALAQRFADEEKDFDARSDEKFLIKWIENLEFIYSILLSTSIHKVSGQRRIRMIAEL